MTQDPIQTLWLEKRRRRPNYSLRALARDLGVSPSYLCDHLNQRRKLSPKMIERVGLKIGLNEEQIKLWQTRQSIRQPIQSVTLDPERPWDLRLLLLQALMRQRPLASHKDIDPPWHPSTVEHLQNELHQLLSPAQDDPAALHHTPMTHIKLTNNSLCEFLVSVKVLTNLDST